MKKGFFCLYLGLVMAICLFFSLGAFFFPPDEAAEGRELTTLPALRHEDGRINWDFTAALEPYFAERFALRAPLVTLDSLLRENLFATGSQTVIVGREGYLFFGETLDGYLGLNPMTDAEIAAAADALAALCGYARARGADFLFAAAPNKATVCGQYMPARYIAAAGERDLDRLHAALDARGVPYVDLRPVLAGEGLYHRRDTHWNGEGARLAYAAMLDAAGFPHDDFADAPHTVVHDFPGDLDALLTPALRRTDDNVVYTLPAYATNAASPMDLVITTSGPGDGSILLFRDSFGSALLPWFAAATAHARLERALPFRIDLLDREPADLVIVEIAERNLRNLIESAARVGGTD